MAPEIDPDHLEDFWLQQHSISDAFWPHKSIHFEYLWFQKRYGTNTCTKIYLLHKKNYPTKIYAFQTLLSVCLYVYVETTTLPYLMSGMGYLKMAFIKFI